MASSVTLWTIGHSTRPLAEFADLLTTHEIAALADVRRFPGSRRHPQFNSDALFAALTGIGIRSESFSDLGGRRTARPDSTNVAWRNASFRGYADYMETAEFHAAIDRLLDMARVHRTAVMCAEAVWWRCHRALISDYLMAAGHRVLHIGASGAPTLHPYTTASTLIDGRLSYGGDPTLGL
jgi:uncharacterized protein (DUF488 family)